MITVVLTVDLNRQLSVKTSVKSPSGIHNLPEGTTAAIRGPNILMNIIIQTFDCVFYAERQPRYTVNTIVYDNLLDCLP